MNRTGQIIVIAILALLIVMFGVGMFFAGPVSAPITPASSSTESAAPGTSAPATQIVQYEPPQPASSTPVAQGSCWTNSLAAPFRGDAWRCTVGNSISDPCFQIPGTAKLFCGADPADPNSTSSFVLALTKPLPASQPLQGLQPADNAWLIELQGGTRCSPYTGTLPAIQGGEAPIYGCAPGALGKDLNVFGITTSSNVWTAQVGTIAPAPADSTSGMPVVINMRTVPIATVWK